MSDTRQVNEADLDWFAERDQELNDKMTTKPEGPQSRSMQRKIALQKGEPMPTYVPATPAPSQPAAREFAIHELGEPISVTFETAIELAAAFARQQTAAKEAEIERLTAFVSGDGEPDVMAAMWMADRAALPKGETRDRFIEEARRLFRLNSTAQSDRAALPKGETRDRFIEEARRLFRLNSTAQSDRQAAERERDSLRDECKRLYKCWQEAAALKVGKEQ